MQVVTPDFIQQQFKHVLMLQMNYNEQDLLRKLPLLIKGMTESLPQLGETHAVVSWSEFVFNDKKKDKALPREALFLPMSTKSWSDRVESDAELPLLIFYSHRDLLIAIKERNQVKIYEIFNKLREDIPSYIACWRSLSEEQQTYLVNNGFDLIFLYNYHKGNNDRMLLASCIASYLQQEIKLKNWCFVLHILRLLISEKGLIIFTVLEKIGMQYLNFIMMHYPKQLQEIFYLLRRTVILKTAEEFLLENKTASRRFTTQTSLISHMLFGVPSQCVSIGDSYIIDVPTITSAMITMITMIAENYHNYREIIHVLFLFFRLIDFDVEWIHKIFSLFLHKQREFAIPYCFFAIPDFERMVWSLSAEKAFYILNLKDKHGETIFTNCIQQNRLETPLKALRYLAQETTHTCFLNFLPSGNFLNNFLHWVCWCPNEKLVVQLFDLIKPEDVKTMLNQKNNNGDTPLMFCLKCKHLFLAQKILQKYAANIDYELRDFCGDSILAMLIVFLKNESDVVDLMNLIPVASIKCMLNMQNVNGKIPLTLAKNRKMTIVKKDLRMVFQLDMTSV